MSDYDKAGKAYNDALANNHTPERERVLARLANAWRIAFALEGMGNGNALDGKA